ncbi:MAG: S-layer protein, partial [Bacteroidales bacterium]
SDIELSSAPLGLYNGRFGQRYYGWNAYDAGYQEVEKWLREDKHDFIAPMMYYKGPMFYPFVADWCLRSHGKRIVPGLGIYRLNEPATDWTLNEIEKQIWWSRRLGASGYVLFRAKNLLNDHPSLYWRMQYLNE